MEEILIIVYGGVKKLVNGNRKWSFVSSECYKLCLFNKCVFFVTLLSIRPNKKGCGSILLTSRADY